MRLGFFDIFHGVDVNVKPAYPCAMDQNTLRHPTGIRAMCEVADHFGIDPKACLKRTDLSLDRLDDPGVKASLRQEIRVIQNLVTLLPDQPCLGWMVGQKLHIGSFGIWGFAIVTSPTLRSAIKTAMRYVNLSYVIADMSLTTDKQQAQLAFDFCSLPAEIHRFVFERHLSVALTFFRDFLRQDQLSGFQVYSTLFDKDYSELLAGEVKLPVATGKELNALVFPADLLDRPLPKADPVTQKYCLDQCKALLEQGQGRLPPWSQRSREALIDCFNRDPDPMIGEIATILKVSERTLRRRLQDEKSSFRQLKSKARLTLAKELMVEAGLSVEVTAHRVGYSEASAFVRAFTREFGVTPGSLRKNTA